MTAPGTPSAPASGADGPPDVPRRTTRALQWRVNVALAVAALVLVGAVAAGVGALVEVRERQEQVVGLYFTAITETDRDYQRVLNAETSVRDFLLTGDARTLEALDTRGVTDGDAAGVDVDALLVDAFGEDSDVVASRGRAVAAVTRWYEGWAEPAMARVRDEGPGGVSEADLAEGRALFAAIEGPYEEHIAHLHEHRATAVADLERASWVLIAAVAALAVLLVAGGVLLWVFLRRWVTGPLERLAEDARAVAGGDRRHPVEAHGVGEVAQVGRAVEGMRRQLVDAIDEVDRARADLEESHERLREQTEDLARSNRDLEQFAYVASHDLQEPLRKVASFTQLLAKRYEGQLDERADQYIGFAVDGAKRMQRLINDLLDFSRVGRIGGELTDVDLGAVVGQVVEDLGAVVEEAGARVEVEDLPVVRGEEPLLRQLVLNLVGNALKFRHPDRPPVVRLSARRTGDVWEVACADNGIGIDPQYADRVFVIFQRLHAKDVYEGTGIGLALCKKIVEYHGGDIWVDQEVEVGTTVRWTLPAVDADPADPDPQTRTTEQEGSST